MQVDDADQTQPRPGLKDLATPVTRLNWRDLEPLANGDEMDKEVSPNDKILWDNKQNSTYATGLSPMLGRKKRARSSSPASSPATDKHQAPAVNIKKLAKALRSPHPDPTLDLWDRFTLTSPASQKTPIAHPALAQLMVSSSPQPNKQTIPQSGNANLRRAASCGLNWPKRRKLEKSKSGSQLSKGQRDLEAASKSSLVSALLSTVTSSIQEENSDDNRQSIELPSSEKKTKHVPVTTSPAYIPCKANGKEATGDSSDYGDDEFDDDALMELELHATTNPATQETPSKRNQAKPAVAPATEAKADEFDDDLDDGLFDNADIDQLSQNPQAAEARRSNDVNTTTREKPVQLAVELEDEFDDDFAADIDFEAVELAATQSIKQVKGGAGVSIPYIIPVTVAKLKSSVL